MYSVHLWLPKAHVEAPVSGSMILAGVILKLGGYGLYRLAGFFFMASLNLWFSLLRGVGGRILAILCCRIMDIKVLIAYSSVVHMSLIIVNLINLRSAGFSGVL
jgi:NADH-ubiquinone oxidoreductase chain 4